MPMGLFDAVVTGSMRAAPVVVPTADRTAHVVGASPHGSGCTTVVVVEHFER